MMTLPQVLTAIDQGVLATPICCHADRLLGIPAARFWDMLSDKVPGGLSPAPLFFPEMPDGYRVLLTFPAAQSAAVESALENRWFTAHQRAVCTTWSLPQPLSRPAGSPACVFQPLGAELWRRDGAEFEVTWDEPLPGGWQRKVARVPPLIANLPEGVMEALQRG